MPKITGTRLLTDATIRAWHRLAVGASLHDGGGLYLRRKPGGCYWALRQTNLVTKTRTWAALLPGVPYPVATLQQAREEADRARLLPAQNTDLVRQREQARSVAHAALQREAMEKQRRLTVRQLFDRWATTELTPRTRADGTRTGRKDGGDYTRQQFERRVFPAVGDTAAVDVTRADWLAILDAAKAEGKLRTCNVLLADMKQMLRFAVARDIIPVNPLDTVTKRDAGGAETERDRVLSLDELRALFGLLPGAGLHDRSRLAVPLILATGCRIGELMGAAWEHVDLDRRKWHLPTTKNQRDHTIHLSDFAAEQFAALLALREQEQAAGAAHAGKRSDAHRWVFPSSTGVGPVGVKSFGKQLADRQRPADRRMSGRSKRTLALALPGGQWTAHDLRRTAATLMASLGVSGDVIDECLNHVIESRVRRTYIRDRRPAEQADAFDRLGGLLARVAGTTVADVPSGDSVGSVIALPLTARVAGG